MSSCASCSYPLPRRCGEIWRKTNTLHCCFHCKDGRGHSWNCSLRRVTSVVPAGYPSPQATQRLAPGIPSSTQSLLSSAYEVLRLVGDECVAQTRTSLLPPFLGWNFLFVVATRDDGLPPSGFHRVDCRYLSDIHLLGTADINGRHDGRHPRIQSLFFSVTKWDTAEMNLWWPLFQFLQIWLEKGNKCKATLTKWWLFCIAGRHRSLSCAFAYARTMAWLGASVTVVGMDQKRLCACTRCMSNVAPAEIYIDNVVDILTAQLVESTSDDNPDACDRLGSLIEFADYAVL